MATVLVIGSGGREHAVAWKLAQSPKVGSVFVAPGNAGTVGSSIGPESKFRRPPPGVADLLKDFTKLAAWCRENAIDLVFVGPEDPLSRGISDTLTSAGVAVFGPGKAASEIEWSKAFSKQFMRRHGIPTPDFVICEDIAAIDAACNSPELSFKPLVAKASGLAAGKGVVVADTLPEAAAAAKELLNRCGGPVLLEAKVFGPELSLIGFSDGERIVALPPARDRKRRFNGDLGPNTGGMGAAAPCRLDTDKPFSPATESTEDVNLLRRLEEKFLQRAIDGLRSEGRKFVGALYAGLIRTGPEPDDFLALEYNCRLGDPETQALMPLIDCDLYQVCLDCVRGCLTPGPLPCQPARVSLAAVLVQSPYPGSCPGRYPIKGLDTFANMPGDPLLAFHAGTAIDSTTIAQPVTAGGRVCNLVAVTPTPDECRAALLAAVGAKRIRFIGADWRDDIVHIEHHQSKSQEEEEDKASGSTVKQHPTAYSASGVSVAEGDRLVDLIKPLCSVTSLATKSACLEGIGSFGAPYALADCGGDFVGHCPDPVLVSGVDGVGTKLLVAEALNQWGSVGVDLVAMCVNDVLCRGAKPLFFLDTYSCGKLNARVAAQVVAGVADGCLQAGCALVGGETAEMPGVYARDVSVDLVGCCVGIVDRSRLLPRLDQMSVGDPIIGLLSSGLHSNGYSLARKIVSQLPEGYASRVTECASNGDVSNNSSGCLLGEQLLTPTRIYVKQVGQLIQANQVTGLAHITGGGITGNLPRCLPDSLGAKIDLNSWKMSPLFRWLMSSANMNINECLSTFNSGLGMLIITKRHFLDEVLKKLPEAIVVGELVNETGVHLIGSQPSPLATIEFLVGPIQANNAAAPVPLGVLISGTGTNLQALLDFSRRAGVICPYRVALVISNVATAQGLGRAAKAGVPTRVLSHKDYPGGRPEFDAAIVEELRKHNIQLVAMAGFMRIVTRVLLAAFPGKVLNTHPSLLPAFKGAHAHRDVLASGVRVTGCTAHFVVPEVDAGPIVLQAPVPVLPGDTEAILQDRVKLLEHRLFPAAVAAVARGDCRFEAGLDGDRCVWTREPPSMSEFM